jgi:hypothetical protein
MKKTTINTNNPSQKNVMANETIGSTWFYSPSLVGRSKKDISMNVYMLN